MSKLSIIIPVYWNSDTLILLYEDIKEKLLNSIDDYEIVFTDDGSGDNSWQIISELKKKDNRIVAVKLSKNYGEESATLAGLSVCNGDCAVTMPADLQVDTSLIIDMYKSWQNGNKVVLAEHKKRHDDLISNVFAGIYYGIIKKFVNDKMPKSGCNCFLIDRQVINTILNLDEKNSSLILQILWVGYKSEVIPYERKERKIGKGRWTIAKKMKLVLDSVISFSSLPIRFMWIIGILLFILSLIMAILILVHYFTKGIPLVGYSSLMCIILMLSSLIISMLGILGEYIWRTFISSGNRPAFLIDEINKDKNP